MNRGLARLLFIVVFLIPVAWYLILQVFGDNSFSLQLMKPIGDCAKVDGIAVIRASDSISLAKSNYLQRVQYAVQKRDVKLQEMDQNFFDCINQSEADLVLVNEDGLWGVYELSREGVDLLLTELDILMMQNSYGQGTYR